MARSTRIIKGGGIIFLPSDTTYPVWKILINDEDVTPYVLFCEVNLYANERLSYVDLNLDNYLGRFNDKWDYENESIEIDVYFDYSNSEDYKTADPTNKIFHGKIDKTIKSLTSSNGWVMNVTGRDRPELVDIKLTLEFDSETIDNAIKAVIADINAQAGYTVISEGTIESTEITTSASYREMEGIRILEDLLARANFIGRINTDGTYDVFTNGSEICTDESLASGLNIFNCSGVGVDATDIKNNIKVYGKEGEGCLIMHTKKSSVPKPWRKDLIINDTAQETLAQVKDRATKEYDNQSDGEIKASIVSIGLPNLKPGQSIKTFVAYCLDGEYVASNINHIFSMAGIESRVVLNQLEKDGLKLIKNNEKDIREKSTFVNPNGMEYSYHFTFDNDNLIATHSNTQTSDGKLKLTTGNDSGIMISNALELDEDVNYVEVRFNGNDDCDLSTFEVSVDDGENYEEVTAGTKGDPGTQINMPNPGNKLRLKVNLRSSTDKTTPEIESAVVLAKS